MLVDLPRKPARRHPVRAMGLGGFRSSKVWHCIARLLCGLRAHLLQVSSKGHLGEFAVSELSAFCRQPAGALARGIYMLSLSNPFGCWLVSVPLCI